MKTKPIVLIVALAVLLMIPALILHSALNPQVAAPVTARLKVNANISVTVSFLGTPGGKYRVESCDDLVAARWIVAADSLTASASLTEWVDVRPMAAASRFYRVVPSGGVAANAGAVGLTAESVDANRLMTAVNAGDHATVIALLRQYGVGENTLRLMATNLGRPVLKVGLPDEFFRACVSASLAGFDSNVVARFDAARSVGYERPFMIARSLQGDWTTNYDSQVARAPLPPVGVLDSVVNDGQAIQFFRWYDRYASQLHSVVVNWEHLSNHEIKSDFGDASRTMSALFKLIKARNPDAFVWAGVVKQDDRTDEPWLRALGFQPDGLLVWNLRQFHSPFEATQKRLLAIVGEETPLVVAGFYGVKQSVRQAGSDFSAARRTEDAPAREAAERAVLKQMAAIGQAVGTNSLPRLEEKLRGLGYRGLAPHWVLVQSLAEAGRQQ